MANASIMEALENPYRDIDLARLEYFVKDPETKEIVKRWKINPKGHTNPAHKDLRDIVAKYEDFMNNIQQGAGVETARANLRIETTKQILKIGLPNLDYTKEAEDEQVGPALLDKIADDIYSFLVVIGGKGEYQLLRQRLKQAAQNT